MSKVFIGGSRRITRLTKEVKQRLDSIIERQLPVVLGDASGADKAVQQYFHSRGYRNIEVFCVSGGCRNNLGNWQLRAITPERSKNGLDYYASKDRAMATAADVGFMLWDGKSIGTLLNVLRLASQRKKIVVYNASRRKFVDIRAETDLNDFLSDCPPDTRRRVQQQLETEKLLDPHTGQTALL